MSRRHIVGASTRQTATEPASTIPQEFCPVCKRGLYLNPDMEFLINPECYHPMCSNCVNNIFGKGPAQCPYASCNKTLRQRGFRSSFFSDLRVEREVDVRKRVQAVFNMTEDDFETLKAYNDYLQQVEDLTFDLVSGGEAARKKAEQELATYEQKHRDDIEKNKRRGRDAESRRQRRDQAQAEEAQQRRREEQREEQLARAEEKTTRDEVMEALTRGAPGTASEIQARIVAQKRARIAQIAGSHYSSLLNSSTTTTTGSAGLNGGGASLHPSNAFVPPPPSAPANTNSLLSIRGLKDKSAPAREDAEYYSRPYDAFAGVDLSGTRYALRSGGGGGGNGGGNGDEYPNTWLADARARDDHRVPGYSTHEYVARAVFEAFAGLGVDVAEEKADAPRGAGTAGAEAAARTARTGGMGLDMKTEDVFV
ncbi:CDK-activating kinase assembly factor [Hypoxylon fuscum]|nr:CDK-activating kinase assembly factor [Hypoxylon fuscum]